MRPWRHLFFRIYEFRDFKRTKSYCSTDFATPLLCDNKRHFVLLNCMFGFSPTNIRLCSSLFYNTRKDNAMLVFDCKSAIHCRHRYSVQRTLRVNVKVHFNEFMTSLHYKNTAVRNIYSSPNEHNLAYSTHCIIININSQMWRQNFKYNWIRNYFTTNCNPVWPMTFLFSFTKVLWSMKTQCSRRIPVINSRHSRESKSDT